MTRASTRQHRPYHEIQVWCPQEFDLSGADTRYPVFYHGGLQIAWGNFQESTRAVIKEIIVVYTEASSADAGVFIYVGSTGNTAQYHSYTSEASQAIYDVTVIPSSSFAAEDRIFTSHGELLMIRCVGGKTGTGNVRVGVTLSYDYSDSKFFTP